MTKTTRTRVASAATVLALLSIGQVASADVCDEQTGAAYGLCIAFFEANQCDQPGADDSACSIIADQYEGITNEPIEALVVCPCAQYFPSGWYAPNSTGIAAAMDCPDGTTITVEDRQIYFNGIATAGYPEYLVTSQTQEQCDAEPTFTCEAKNTAQGDFIESITQLEFFTCRATTSVP